MSMTHLIHDGIMAEIHEMAQGWHGRWGWRRRWWWRRWRSWNRRRRSTHVGARIDLAELFKDERIQHKVSRQDMADVPNGEFPNEPAVLMEVNDRVIRVYMRAHVPTKQLQKPGNRYSDFRNDLMLIRTYNY